MNIVVCPYLMSAGIQIVCFTDRLTHTFVETLEGKVGLMTVSRGWQTKGLCYSVRTVHSS
jgi:hypothetical protein